MNTPSRPQIGDDSANVAASRSASAATTSAVGLSALAAVLGLCCAMPWAALFGVGGAVLIAQWGEALRPWLLGAGGALMAWAFWQVYRPRRVCADGSCERTPTASLRVSLWLALALLLAATFIGDRLMPWSARGQTQLRAAVATMVPTSALVTLDEMQARLREDFNRDRGKLRLMLLIGPSCGVCLRGMKDVNEDLLSGNGDSKLRTYLVHLPTLNATEKDARRAMPLITGGNPTHYWDPSGRTGEVYAETLDLRDGDDYAWDVWMIYGPDAQWTGAVPPKPDFVMQQLEGLEHYPRLDSKEFARQARRWLNAAAAS